jgi:hypothetical protein
MAVLTRYTCYFDASGKPKDPGNPLVMYVSGFIATEAEWLTFESQWNRFLQSPPYNFKNPFHTVNYVKCDGEDYEQFKNNDPLRDTFERRLTNIIRRNTRHPFSFGLVLPDYRKAQRLYVFPEEYERPYSFCGIQVVYKVVAWMKAKRLGNPEDRLCLIFEDGDDDQDVLSAAMHRHYGFRPNFRKKGQCPPFAASDILAWRHARLLKDKTKVMAGGAWPRREYFTELFRQLPHDSCGYTDLTVLVSFCEKQGYQKRDQHVV